MAIVKTEAHYKVSSFVNHVTAWSGIEGSGLVLDNFVPGAVWQKGISVRSDSNLLVKTGWNTEMLSGGTVTREFLYGKDQYTKLRNFINKDVKLFSLQEAQHGNIGFGVGHMTTNWGKFISHNKLTGEQGWYDIPNGTTYGELIFDSTSTSWTTKLYWDVPSDAKIEAMKTAGIVSEDYCVHEVFPKVKLTLPHKAVYTPTGTKGAKICTAFAYQRTETKDYNQYADWHSCMWVKRANHDMQIFRKGSGRNYLIALKDMTILTPERKERKLEMGRPISLESPYCVLKKEEAGFVLHVHQINTEV